MHYCSLALQKLKTVCVVPYAFLKPITVENISIANICKNMRECHK